MRFGICVSPENVAIAERAGYDYVEFAVETVAPQITSSDFEVLKKNLHASRIKPEAWNKFIPNSLRLVGEDVDLGGIQGFVTTTLGRIGELGGKRVVFGSAGARNIPNGFPRDKAHQQLLCFLQIAADVAAKNEIIIAIEPVLRRACNVLNSVGEAKALARELHRPEVKVLADLFHMAAENEPMSALIDAGEDLYHVHLPVPNIPGLSTPAQEYPHREFLETLCHIDYKQRVSVEDLGKRFTALEREAGPVLSYLKGVCQESAT